MLPEFVYKIATFEQWDEALEKGTFDGAPVDLEDGYIHFSTIAQVRETAQKHFAGQDGLMLVKVATGPMARHYKMEASRGGALFPHLYARLPVDNAVIWEEIQLEADGTFRFPDWFADDESRMA
ncbi:DUF952 domain-containing protein [Salaquimonas pukyongi]|uniref:DUF952 domain-containing protein n=1 Tax=Salaquimonas pukyongi TaxID=2712698 RepID=UPI00096B71B3|nr:DUF952 domain-containing protein [Salaquimonas pukyongi]